MRVTDLGTLAYRAAWDLQEQAHARVLAGGEEELLLVEHPPVVTLGRRAEAARQNLVVGAEGLAKLGVELVESDRGGDVTFHGHGQVVAYPIVRLNDHRLSVGGYVRALEAGVIAALADLGIAADRDPGAVGVWTHDPAAGQLAKVCAIGVRIRRGVSLHGVALNVTTDLEYFNLIVPCGLAGRPVTSVAKLLGPAAPPIDRVRQVLAGRLTEALSRGGENTEPPRHGGGPEVGAGVS
ncbi:MAG TPA: lipoyl(octanoyl) transferase LipB [Humisphaera sp.]